MDPDQAADGADPTDAQLVAAAEQLIEAAVAPFHRPELRKPLLAIQAHDELAVDSVSLPGPDVLAGEIVQDLQAVLAQFAAIAEDLDAAAMLAE